MIAHAMTHKSTPWYKEPMMLLVLGAPAVVVVAALYTVKIAYTHADSVLDRTVAPVTVDDQALQALSPEERKAFLASLQPAGVARNHAASPVVPDSK